MDIMKAADAIGEYLPEDSELNPRRHVERMTSAAEPIIKLLKSSLVDVVIEQYERANTKAAEFQSLYKTTARTEIHLSSAAAILGAIVLYLSADMNVDLGIWRQTILIIQSVCLAGALTARYKLQHKPAFKNWQIERTNAETARIELFEIVCGLNNKHISEQPSAEVASGLLPLQLEYFLRYQLFVQLNYYRDRGGEHEAAAQKFVDKSAYFIFFAAILASFAGMAADFGDWVSICAIGGLLAPVLLSSQTNISRLNQDERNAARYKITYKHLQNFSRRIDLVRKEALGNNAIAVRDFIRSVNEVVSIEHKEWQENQESRSHHD